MKKSFTTLFVIGALIFFSASNVFTQEVPDFDVSKYYLIINHNQETEDPAGGYLHNVIGIDDMNPVLDGALVQQQQNLAPIGTDGHLWQVVAVTDSTFRFINKRSGMALGWTDWTGLNPFFDPDEQPPTTKPAFNWNSQHEGACQRILDVEEPTQVWQPSPFPVASAFDDTLVYRMTSAFELADSGHCFNVWERTVEVNMRNICIFPGVKENDLYIDYTSLYAYYFIATAFEVPPSSIEQRIIQNNFVIYSSDYNIVVEGNIQNQAVEVYNILGGLVYKATAAGSRMDIQVNQGIYIIRIGNFISKIAVR
jgi:hypothetical protein